jgi:regulator of sigma E protease
MSTLLGYLNNSSHVILLAFGFGFVIFWHELGHFLAAKWADVKVEQFAVGFGQALCSWRKGLGFTWGSSNEEYIRRLRQHLAAQSADTEPTEAQLSYAASQLQISETEYRLNWIPLGGYVKMLGQDDMKPGQTVSDPRSYNNKPIGKRMVIVSAGVVMNVILAAIGFMYIFTVGFVVPVPRVGMIQPGSPAQNTFALVNNKRVPTPLRVGDTIKILNGKWQSDFEKIKLNTALLIAGDTVSLDVTHPDGRSEDLFVTPAKATPESEFPQIGMGEYPLLKGPDLDAKDIKTGDVLSPEFMLLEKGDVITAVGSTPLQPDQYYILDEKLQQAAGKPLDVTITNEKTGVRHAKIAPHFLEHFGGEPINFAGMQMLVRVESIQADSSLIASDLKDKIQPGDVVVNLADPGASGAHWQYPTRKVLMDQISAAGALSPAPVLSLTVLRNGKEVIISAKPSVRLATGKVGFGIQLAPDEQNPIVAGVLDGSPAADARVQPGSKILSINGVPVHSWFDVNNIMGTLKADEPIHLVAELDNVPKTYELKGLNVAQLTDIRSNLLASNSLILLQPDEYPRKAKNPLQAAQWGVGETRDAILQVYQTVRSMLKHNISPNEISGPVGILTAGYMVAEKGFTRLVWFLSIISANLAVMNFLPIPIVDGGLFTFLIIEKIKGSPINPRVLAAAQVVGLALLLSVFLFATYHDVVRLPSMFR